MKKSFILLFAILILLSALCYSAPSKSTYLRIHIRANSNQEFDQAVKYAVKESVTEFLTPIVSECTDLSTAMKKIGENLKNIEKVADKTLKENGANYTSSAKIKNEKFPTRVYGELTLESGFYDALIINLGSGSGENWWCVVYPPLCFVGSGTDYIYQSKIYQIISDFMNKER